MKTLRGTIRRNFLFLSVYFLSKCGDPITFQIKGKTLPFRWVTNAAMLLFLLVYLYPALANNLWVVEGGR